MTIHDMIATRLNHIESELLVAQTLEAVEALQDEYSYLMSIQADNRLMVFANLLVSSLSPS